CGIGLRMSRRSTRRSCSCCGSAGGRNELAHRVKCSSMSRLRLVLCLWVMAVASSAFGIGANQMTEVALALTRFYTDPFNEVELDVVVTTPEGTLVRVPAFWAGTDWRFRYSSPLVGVHRWKSECSDKT